ncbi:protein of unknown function [Hyphomicrobium sp. MC1]|nr:protein of unknown function [Hyphomicrobium sp. MC1]
MRRQWLSATSEHPNEIGRNPEYPAIGKTQHDYNLMAAELRRDSKGRPNKPASGPDIVHLR